MTKILARHASVLSIALGLALFMGGCPHCCMRTGFLTSSKIWKVLRQPLQARIVRIQR